MPKYLRSVLMPTIYFVIHLKKNQQKTALNEMYRADCERGKYNKMQMAKFMWQVPSVHCKIKLCCMFESVYNKM